LARLAPPSWPEEVFGRIDRDKAKVGKALFMEYCASCHNAWPYRWTEPNKYGKRFILVGLTPQTYVGTDRTQFEAVRPFAISGHLRNYLPPEFRDKEVVPGDVLQAILQNTIRQTAIAKLKLTDAESRVEWLSSSPPRRGPSTSKAAPPDGCGHCTLHAQWIGAQPLRDADSTKRADEEFYLGGDPDPVKVEYSRRPRNVPDGHGATRQFECRSLSSMGRVAMA
jgi:hypothetical protein